MVLFLFVIMLLNIQKLPAAAGRPIHQFFAWVGGFWFGFMLIYYISKAAVLSAKPEVFASTARDLGLKLFEAYLLPFEFASILLLAAIVGALVITQRIEKRIAPKEGSV